VRARAVEEIVEQAQPFLRDRLDLDDGAVAKHWAKDPPTTGARMQRLRDALATADWNEEALESTLRGLADELEVGAGKLIHPLRVALTGQSASPGIFEVLVLLGRDRALARLDEAIHTIGTLGR